MTKGVLTRQETGLTGTFSFNKIAGLKLVCVTFALINKPFFFSYKRIAGEGKDGYPASIVPRQRWEQREKGNLWWTSMIQTLKAKKVVRSHCARKLRHAFVQSLNEHGYDRNGWDLRGKKYGALLGTLEMHFIKEMITAPIAKVKEDTDILVKWIEKKQSDAVVLDQKLPDANTSKSLQVRRLASAQPVTRSTPGQRQIVFQTRQPNIPGKDAAKRTRLSPVGTSSSTFPPAGMKVGTRQVPIRLTAQRTIPGPAVKGKAIVSDQRMSVTKLRRPRREASDKSPDTSRRQNGERDSLALRNLAARLSQSRPKHDSRRI